MLCEVFMLEDGRLLQWRAQAPHLMGDPDLEADIRATLARLYPLPRIEVSPTGPYLSHPTEQDPDAVAYALTLLGIPFVRLGDPADSGGIVT